MIYGASSEVTTAVIGAGGFLGTRLCDVLRAEGRTVVPFTRYRSFEVDGRLDPAFDDADVILYLATSVTPGDAEIFPQRAISDYEHLERLLYGLARLRTQPLFIFASSSTNYDPAFPAPYPEEAPTKPQTVYGEIKLLMEKRLLSYGDAVKPLVLRLASMYGPGHPKKPGHGVIAHWLHSVAENGIIEVFGNDDIRRDFIYVDDAVDAITRAIAVNADGLPNLINVGSGHPTSLADLRQKVIATTRCEPQIVRYPSRRFDRRELWLNIDLAKSELSWRPTTSLSKGLRATWLAL